MIVKDQLLYNYNHSWELEYVSTFTLYVYSTKITYQIVKW